MMTPLGLRETLSGLAEDSTAESDPFGISPNLPLDDNTPMSPIFSWPIARVASDPSVLPPEPLLLPRPGLSPDQVETLRCSEDELRASKDGQDARAAYEV